jgi:hypothetical protein
LTVPFNEKGLFGGSRNIDLTLRRLLVSCTFEFLSYSSKVEDFCLSR